MRAAVGPAKVRICAAIGIVVFESGKTYDAKTTCVLYSQEIRDYLDAKCTPDDGTQGWRLRDKDVSADNDTAFQKQLWAAVRPKVTALPCWAIERDGAVDIIPLPATVADGLVPAFRELAPLDVIVRGVMNG